MRGQKRRRRKIANFVNPTTGLVLVVGFSLVEERVEER